jgi:hypothetical protein
MSEFPRPEPMIARSKRVTPDHTAAVDRDRTPYEVVTRRGCGRSSVSVSRAETLIASSVARRGFTPLGGIR